jgi:predicted MFS family arabinose efflux permease
VQLDVGGFSTLSLGVTAVVLLASWGGTRYAWDSPAVLGLAGCAVGAAAGFVVAERRAASPIIPLGLFANRTFTAAVVAGLVLAVAMFGTVGYLPTYLQMVSGLSPTAAGLAMLTLVAGLALSTVGSAQLVRRTGRYKILPLVGAGLTAAALGLLAALTPTTPLGLAGGALFLLGLGIGCAWEVLVVVVQNSAPDAVVGTATAANSFFREIGVCLGSAVVGALFTARLGTLLDERLHAAGAELDPQSLTPALVRALPDGVRQAVVGAYNDALTPVFALLVPVVLVAALALLAVREVPLATAVAAPDPTVTAPADSAR